MNRVAAFFRAVIVLTLLVLCLLAVLAAAAGVLLPRVAAQRFGPPSAALSLPQQAMYSLRLLYNEDALQTPLDPAGTPRTFTIPMGESVNAISSRLEEEGFIATADLFRTYLIYAGLDTTVQAGKYQLSPAMTPLDIAAALQDPTPTVVDFAILPGWRAEEVAAALPTSGLAVTPEAFLAVVRQPPAALLPPGMPVLASLEGYLMPGLYEIPRSSTAEDLARMFVQRFVDSVPQDVLDGFTAQGLTLPEAVILASIVEREAVVDDEQALIASVFYNRLAVSMKLDSDPTVQYALGFDLERNTWWKVPLSSSDLEVVSGYNTYSVPGLPPGPICNPSLEALRAVAYPAQTGYYYFRALCDGSGRHAFAVTYEEHLNNACP